MSKSISKRGVVVDFDLLRMKQEILSATPNDVVVERSESIEDSILKRREQRRRQRQLQLEKQAKQLNDVVDVSTNTEEQDEATPVEKPSKIKENRTRIINEE